jgi:hypothetical protein
MSHTLHIYLSTRVDTPRHTNAGKLKLAVGLHSRYTGDPSCWRMDTPIAACALVLVTWDAGLSS